MKMAITLKRNRRIEHRRKQIGLGEREWGSVSWVSIRGSMRRDSYYNPTVCVCACVCIQINIHRKGKE